MPSSEKADSLCCSHCSRLFTHKSSRIRHEKRCLSGHRAPSRQKACRNCTTAKVRCDQRRPSCGRCRARSTLCGYVPQTEEEEDGTASTEDTSSWRRQQQEDEDEDTNPISPARNTPLPSSHPSTDPPPEATIATTSEFAALPPPAMILSDRRRRVLLGSAPGAPRCDAVARHTMHFVVRVLKSWPRMLALHGFALLPPVIHNIQVADGLPEALANCHALVCMWAACTPGSEALVQKTVLLEVERLLREHPSLPEPDLLPAAQSLLLLLIILFFGFSHSQDQEPHPLSAPLLIAIWDVKAHLASTGLFLPQEQESSPHQIPPWKAWSLVSAKRRTLLALNHLEWAWSLMYGYPVLTCFELGPLPAPAAGYLWRETDEKVWEGRYREWKGKWGAEGGYKMCEFFGIDPRGALDARSEMWLAEADEYGVMLMAEVNALGDGG